MTYIAVSLGFIVGVVVGAVLDDVWDLYKAYRREKKTKMTHQDDGDTKKKGTVFTTNTLATLLIVCCLSLLGVGISLIITRNSTEAYAQCTAQWQQRFMQAYIPRTEAAAEVSQSIDRIMLAVNALDGRSQEAQAEFKGALENYLQVRNKQDQERQSNPLPELPKTVCGEP